MKKKPKVSIIDYGVGNLRSLIRAFEHFDANVSITEDASDITSSAAIVLPGDGAFKSGMNGLKVRNLTDKVLDFGKSAKPMLGICLGAQILVTEGFEFGHHKGLGLIDGRVVKFKNIGEKIPQIGWNQLVVPKGKNWEKTILRNVVPGASVYFIHSYIIEPEDKKNILALTKYGGQNFASVIYKDNIYGCQFHPEKSGAVGLAIINNFIKLCL